MCLPCLRINLNYFNIPMPRVGFRGGPGGKEPVCQCRKYKKLMFNPRVKKILWRRKWQPIPVFLSG